MIQAQAGTKRQNLSDIVQFCLRTARYESHKELGRNLEQDFKLLEDCAQVNALFLDKGSNQLFTIAYTEDDDYQNTAQNLINMSIQRVQKLSQ